LFRQPSVSGRANKLNTHHDPDNPDNIHRPRRLPPCRLWPLIPVPGADLPERDGKNAEPEYRVNIVLRRASDALRGLDKMNNGAQYALCDVEDEKRDAGFLVRVAKMRRVGGVDSGNAESYA
jgi:hypothetical protein